MAEEQNNVKESFDTLNLKEKLLRGIYSYGFENPSFIQTKSVPVMVNGDDMIAQAQSGTGKTGAFVMGALQKLKEEEKSTQILIISPTHELVHQSYEVISEISKYMDVTSLKVMGGTSVNDCKQELNRNPQIIMGSP